MATANPKKNEFLKEKAEPVKLTDLEKGISFKDEKWQDRRSRRKIQKRELREIRKFFVGSNIGAGLLVSIMALIEHFHPPQHPIITDKVIIAVLAGITLQAGGIILAAFKGLFSEK